MTKAHRLFLVEQCGNCSGDGSYPKKLGSPSAVHDSGVRQAPCPFCHGKGYQPKIHKIDINKPNTIHDLINHIGKSICVTCNGSGKYKLPLTKKPIKCQDCKGTGFVLDDRSCFMCDPDEPHEDCSTCRGSGVYLAEMLIYSEKPGQNPKFDCANNPHYLTDWLIEHDISFPPLPKKDSH